MLSNKMDFQLLLHTYVRMASLQIQSYTYVSMHTLFDRRSLYFPVYTSGAMNPGVPTIEPYLIWFVTLDILLTP